MRRSSKILRVHYKTIARRARFLAQQARLEHEDFLLEYSKEELKFLNVQFDEMKTSEHTKCKPLSIALAVGQKSRKILGIEVSQIPADGPLAKISVKKYGKRLDERDLGLNRLFLTLGRVVNEQAHFSSDKWQSYRGHVLRHFPKASHDQFESRRAHIAGQGELKKIGFDPLFSINHTCAMIRANVNRLFRRTWCTTKKRERLLDHLMIYVAYHNQALTT
jgi:hypothetical protein